MRKRVVPSRESEIRCLLHHHLRRDDLGLLFCDVLGGLGLEYRDGPEDSGALF